MTITTGHVTKGKIIIKTFCKKYDLKTSSRPVVFVKN